MKFLTTYINCGAGDRMLRIYLPDQTAASYYKQRPAVVIFPGGAYRFTYEGEAEPIALAFASKGICAFLLDYSCKDRCENVNPYVFREAFSVIKYVRDNAEEFKINPNNVSTLGFSAGGHLCASTGTLWNKMVMRDFLGENYKEYRPDRMILCYPVVDLCHRGSFENLLGKDNLTEENINQFTLTNQVDNETPPAFIWTTAEDTGVPIKGVLGFAKAMAEHNKHIEMHIYPHGGHGSCLGNHVTCGMPYSDAMLSSEWVDNAVRFIYDDKVLDDVK